MKRFALCSALIVIPSITTPAAGEQKGSGSLALARALTGAPAEEILNLMKPSLPVMIGEDGSDVIFVVLVPPGKSPNEQIDALRRQPESQCSLYDSTLCCLEKTSTYAALTDQGLLDFGVACQPSVAYEKKPPLSLPSFGNGDDTKSRSQVPPDLSLELSDVLTYKLGIDYVGMVMPTEQRTLRLVRLHNPVRRSLDCQNSFQFCNDQPAEDGSSNLDLCRSGSPKNWYTWDETAEQYCRTSLKCDCVYPAQGR